MIKKLVKTTLVVLLVFLLIVILGLISKVFSKNNYCDQNNQACPGNYLCNFNKKVCVAAEKCPDKKVEVCITLYAPVCNNGKEYSNSCFACIEEDVKYYYKGKC